MTLQELFNLIKQHNNQIKSSNTEKANEIKSQIQAGLTGNDLLVNQMHVQLLITENDYHASYDESSYDGLMTPLFDVSTVFRTNF